MATSIPDSCSICLNGFTTEKPMQLYCGHIFGSECLETWLWVSRNKDCPVCRRRLIHSCGHLCRARHLTPSSCNQTVVAPTLLQPTTVLDPSYIACYIKGHPDTISEDRILIATRREITRKLGIEILIQLGVSEWRGVSGTWEEILEQLIEGLSNCMPSISDEEVEQRLAELKRWRLESQEDLNAILFDILPFGIWRPGGKAPLEWEKSLEKSAERCARDIAGIEADEHCFKNEIKWINRNEILVAAVKGGKAMEMTELVNAWSDTP